MVFTLACFSCFSNFDMFFLHLGPTWAPSRPIFGTLGPCWGPPDLPWEHFGVILGPIMTVMPSSRCQIVPQYCLLAFIRCQLVPHWLHIGIPGFNFEEKTRRISMVSKTWLRFKFMQCRHVLGTFCLNSGSCWSHLDPSWAPLELS